MFCHSFRDLAAKKIHTVSKNFHEVYQNYILAVLRITWRVVLKKRCFYRFRKLSIFRDFFRKLFNRLSKLLYSSCPEKNFQVEILFNFSIFLNFFINFSCWSNFLGLLTTFFSRVVKIAFHVPKRSLLGKLQTVWKKFFF